MKVSAAKTTQRVERNVYLTSKKIKAYGLDNDYPQKVLEIVNSSGTGKVCLDQYIKFIEGGGFADQTLSYTIINKRNEKADQLLRKCARDLRVFDGFAVLVKYDGLAVPYAYYSVPFEHCRIEINAEKEYTGRIAIHPDWTGISGIRFNLADIKYVDTFNPNKVVEQMIEAGGPENYLGQLMYFTSDGELEYPMCPFDPIVTDMLTEESCSTVKHRNAKHNFLPAGILVRKGIKPRTTDTGEIDPKDPYNKEQIESAESLKKLQGDTNASKIWVVDVDADEEKPEFIEFKSANFDRHYEHTEKTVQENIGKMFLLPPILRGVDVGAGFGADLMNNAYDYMNSVTGNERRMLEEAFTSLFKLYPAEFSDFSILPLSYVTPRTENKTNDSTG